MPHDPFIAVDWGTTHRRILLIEDGGAVRFERDNRGASSLRPDDYPDEVAGIRALMGHLPVLLTGMAGSTLGWCSVPYVDAPAELADVARGTVAVADNVWITPGVAVRASRPDVMRGEEIQFLGAAAAGLVPPSGLLCQPGTHCKWANLHDKAIVDFTTAMTGEVFALLSRYSILAPQISEMTVPDEAFMTGVRDGARGDLLADLFSARARAVLQVEGETSSYVSGLLIGADAARRITGIDVVYVLADGVLASLYACALETLGCGVVLIDSQTAFIAGVNRIRSHIA